MHVHYWVQRVHLLYIFICCYDIVLSFETLVVACSRLDFDVSAKFHVLSTERLSLILRNRRLAKDLIRNKGIVSYF